MAMKTFIRFYLIVSILTFCGCAKLTHLTQLLTIKRYSDNKDLQAKFVNEENQKFERMLELVKTGKINQYKNKKEFLAAIGEPITKFPKKRHGFEYEQWLYRKTGTLKDGEKVYLYFDKEGNLKDWEHYIPKAVFSETKYKGGPGG